MERYDNDYGGLIARWKVDLIRVRARKYFFRPGDIPDLEQIIVPELLAAAFDPKNYGGVPEQSFVIAVIDRQLMKIMRDRKRDVRRISFGWESLDQAIVREKAFFAMGRSERHALRLDVQQALEKMTPAERAVCEALSEGRSQAEIARETGRSRTSICRVMKKLRGKFRRQGLTERIGSE